MFKKLIVLSVVAATVMLTGCSSVPVPLESKEIESITKTFPNPPSGKAGLYVYRGSNLIGRANTQLKVVLDGDSIGRTSENTYFYKVISPGQHKLDTQTTIGPSVPLVFNAEAGHNYFVKQDPNVSSYVIYGGTSITMVDEAEGEKGVLECEQAK
ncbi:DUF2846 domain-containing protein [Ferrovum myxofaciens]|uniref:DUF2846 domain-containing protein n=1 Tax=Ferrovum myxofaciens TaxID=416213 RepID=A0A9E6MZ50_9PROT|nr:DUF2846 domain-containing protein [Ferrovum myxofaciens]QKE37361.1 MAG: DUF2846 domain-containing protein [Ferrovum myxofaciens]QWY75017.1 MAG: DUF2846 domain-containing protein [Ferrovum myxofaciens]QWY77757.1 MAG: DUF2846 domain-containing protein [Ferrovum myxofaciens]